MTTPQPPKNIIILGGSYAGISTAHHTLKHTLPFLPSSTSYQIILISTSSQALCRPACPRALLSDSMFPQDKLFVDVAEQFQHYPQDIFRFVHGSATAVDHVKRTVAYELVSTGETQVLEFFALVVATGASTPSPLMGFNSNDAKGLRECWEEIRAKLKEAKSIVVAGGGPTGVETAGELGEFLNGRAGMFGGGLKDRKVRITLVTAGTQILPALRPALAETAEGYLKKVGVEVVKDTRIVSVEPEDAGTREGGLTKRVTLKLSRGQGIEADLFIPTTGMEPNTSFLSSTLLTPTRQVSTNISTLRVDVAGPRIYAIGDCSSYARPAIHNILAAVPILGAHIKRDLLLDAGVSETEVRTKEKVFKEDTREMQLVPIGRSKGVGAAMGWKLPSWLVWAIKGRDYWLWTVGGLWTGKQWAKEG